MDEAKQWHKIKVMKEEDRAAMAQILVKEGYEVRQRRYKETEKSRAYTYYIEYFKE